MAQVLTQSIMSNYENNIYLKGSIMNKYITLFIFVLTDMNISSFPDYTLVLAEFPLHTNIFINYYPLISTFVTAHEC
jgi:hypothetical protein